MIRLRFLLFSLVLGLGLQAQEDYSYKEIIKNLTDSSFYGRGYVHNGDKIAAKYIAGIYQHYGLQSWDKRYFQRFELDVNTFPQPIQVSLNNNEPLETGKDFIVAANSGTAKGKYTIVKVTLDDFSTDKKIKEVFSPERMEQNTAFFLDLSIVEDQEKQNELRGIGYTIAAKFGPVILRQDNKLMWSVGREAMKFPLITIGPRCQENIEGTIEIDIYNQLKFNYKSQNVIGYVEGKKYKDQYIIVCAHYDHLGQLGNAIFPGGNDNASGTAGMIEMMKYYVENPHDYTVVFIAFGGEEAGLVGSSYYVEHPVVPLEQTKFVLDLDIMGSADDGITVVNGTQHTVLFEQMDSINREKQYIPSVKARKPTQNSDHAPFHEKGVDAFFIYTRGSATMYHEPGDTYENLPLVNFEPLVQLLIDFTNTIE